MDKFFNLSARGTTVKREIIAGITTFLAMAYILSVNPGMLGSIPGMSAGGVFTATALASALATLVMALAANLPIALAPGMGLNAFFTYTVVGSMGYSWQIALTAVFLEGVLFIILSLFNVREAIIKAIPTNLKKAVAVGIGLFIALIGLSNAGILLKTDAGSVIIGFAPLEGSALVAVIGLLITVILYTLRVPGAILIGIILTTIVGIPFGVTKIPEGFKAVSLPEAPLFWKFDFSQVLTLKFFTVFFTFLFVDIFDTIGTLVGVTTEAGLTDKDGNIPKAKQALLADAIGTVAGAALGTSTVTSFVESSSGVAAGGRTGLSSIVTAVLFVLALFLSPLFLLVPSAATAPALIFVGFLMIKAVAGIEFEDLTEGIPCFITIIVMPFAYSIADGIAWGIITYVILNLVKPGNYKKISIVTWVLFVIFILRFFI